MVVTKTSEFHMCITYCILKTIIKIKITITYDDFLNKPQFHHMNIVHFAYKLYSYNIYSAEMQTDQKLLQE